MCPGAAVLSLIPLGMGESTRRLVAFSFHRLGVYRRCADALLVERQGPGAVLDTLVPLPFSVSAPLPFSVCRYRLHSLCDACINVRQRKHDAIHVVHSILNHHTLFRPEASSDNLLWCCRGGPSAALPMPHVLRSIGNAPHHARPLSVGCGSPAWPPQ